MMKTLVGVNIPGGTNLGALDAALARIAADGFDAAELNLSFCPLIIGGKVQPLVLQYVSDVLAKYPLKITAHAGYGMDLRNLADQEMQRAVLFASIDVCAALHLSPLNCHYEEFSRRSAEENAYLSNMKEAAAYAEAKGVPINVENIEVEDVRYALEAVQKIGHPNCGMTLDLGHLYLSSRYFGYDFLDAVRTCAPFVRHLHINDNHGIFEPMRIENHLLYDTLDRGYRFAYSRGDIHIPPFWGDVPLKAAFSELKKVNYSGVWLCEYYSHLFHPLNGAILAEVRRQIEQA